MKKIYAIFCNPLLIAAFFMIAFAPGAKALVAGDIAFTGYISSNTTDEFSFVLRVAIPANTVINFTDNGWTGTALRTTETTVTWTSNAAFPAGAEIRISGTTATYAGLGLSAGTVTGTALALSTAGDQILAYQGTAASPTFISGIHMNFWTTGAGDPSTTTAANWDGQSISSVSSAMPTGLTGGSTAIWIYTATAQHPTEKTNARFNCTGSLTNVANFTASLYNFANWIGDANVNPTNASFTLPTTCNYSNTILPITLANFTARNTGNAVVANWTAENAVNFSHFELERSNGNNNFSFISRIEPNATGKYSFTDEAALQSNASLLYYRLKMVDRDGSISYSEIARIRLNKGEGFVLDNLVNPIKDRISFNYTSSNNGIVTLELVDMQGKRIATKSYSVTPGTTAMQIAGEQQLGSGVYILRITSGKTTQSYKLIR
jgi:hypothetical protein